VSEPTPRERFEAIVRQPDSHIDLAEAALWIAAEDAPPVAVDVYLRRIDAIADAARPAVAAARSEAGRLAALHRALFVEHGFTGNRDDYYDPRNSWLHHVIDRRVGIPITLSLVYLAVADRLGFDARGVSFPGHFLVKHAGETPALVDPFFGRVLAPADVADRLAEVAGPGRLVGLAAVVARGRRVERRLVGVGEPDAPQLDATLGPAQLDGPGPVGDRRADVEHLEDALERDHRCQQLDAGVRQLDERLVHAAHVHAERHHDARGDRTLGGQPPTR